MEKTKFKIQGIKCDNCSLLIEEKLKNAKGVLKVKIDQTSSKGVVIFDEQKMTEQDIYKAIENINDFHLEKIEEVVLPAENQEQDLGIRKAKFRIFGLKCENCVLLIESRLKNREGVVKIKIDQASSKGVVIYDQQKINESDIYKTIEEIGGFKVEKFENGVENSAENVNYNNPDIATEQKPPIGALTAKKVFAGIIVLILLFQVFSFLPRNNQASKATGSVKNALAQEEQVNSNQPAQAPKGTEKSGSPVLEAYVVSRCPFGLQMQRIMADVVKNVSSLSSNIKVRYMGSVSNGTITSMHGNAEAQENLRQICIRDEQPKKYWEYVSCQMKSSGQEAACEKSTGVDSAKLSSCISDPNKGIAYAQKDFELNRKYSITGSPTLIMNGQRVSEFDFGGRTSDAIKKTLCSGFNNPPAACKNNLNTGSAATSFSASYN